MPGLKKRIILYIKRKQTSRYIWNVWTKAKNSKNWFVRHWNLCRLQNLRNQFNAEMPVAATIDGMPTFPHGLSGIYISKGARIGKGCTIFQQVTIGSNTLNDSKGKGAPKIGNNVYIGAGAKIIGNVVVGNNVRIGANCVIVKDIPDNATVVLEQPRIIISEEPRKNDFQFF